MLTTFRKLTCTCLKCNLVEIDFCPEEMLWSVSQARLGWITGTCSKPLNVTHWMLFLLSMYYVYPLKYHYRGLHYWPFLASTRSIFISLQFPILSLVRIFQIIPFAMICQIIYPLGNLRHIQLLIQTSKSSQKDNILDTKMKVETYC